MPFAGRKAYNCFFKVLKVVELLIFGVQSRTEGLKGKSEASGGSVGVWQ